MSTKRLVQPWWGGKQGLIEGAAPFCGADIATQFPGKYDAVNTQIQIQYIKHPNTVPALGVNIIAERRAVPGRFTSVPNLGGRGFGKSER